METHRNRREAQRYPLSLSLDYGAGCGMTCDVSSFGAYFLTTQALEPGARLQCTLAAGGERLEFEAEVVRVERCGRKFGVAARFEALQTDLAGAAVAADVLGVGSLNG